MTQDITIIPKGGAYPHEGIDATRPMVKLRAYDARGTKYGVIAQAPLQLEDARRLLLELCALCPWSIPQYLEVNPLPSDVWQTTEPRALADYVDALEYRQARFRVATEVVRMTEDGYAEYLEDREMMAPVREAIDEHVAKLGAQLDSDVAAFTPPPIPSKLCGAEDPEGSGKCSFFPHVGGTFADTLHSWS